MVEGSITGIGYEGMDVDALVARLRIRGVQRVIDIRLNPLSRKKGLSKNGLRERLAADGIEYTHLRALGNPKINRAGFSATSGADASASRAAYREVLETSEAHAALDQIRAFAADENVALLCFEAAEEHCHRELVLRAVKAASLIAV